MKSIFEDKIALLIPGVRGLSNQHADELSDQFKKAGGKVVLPERGKLYTAIICFSVQRKHQGNHERSGLYHHPKDQIGR